jgi:hypothetical protein
VLGAGVDQEELVATEHAVVVDVVQDGGVRA